MSKKFVLFLHWFSDFFSWKYVSVAMGHPVYCARRTQRRGTAERAAVCDLAETCARLCTRVRVYVWRGLVAARLPACLGSRVRCPTGHWTQRDSTWGSSAGTNRALLLSRLYLANSAARPGPSPRDISFSTVYTEGERAPLVPRPQTFYEGRRTHLRPARTPLLLEFGLDTQLLLRTHPRQHFRRWTTRETCRTDVSRPFLYASRITRPNNREVGKSRACLWSSKRKRKKERERERERERISPSILDK